MGETLFFTGLCIIFEADRPLLDELALLIEDFVIHLSETLRKRLLFVRYESVSAFRTSLSITYAISALMKVVSHVVQFISAIVLA